MTQAADNASLGATDDLLTQSRLGRRTFMQAAAGTLGAVCGSWWKGPRGNMPEGYALVDLYSDGSVERTYLGYGWKASEKP